MNVQRLVLVAALILAPILAAVVWVQLGVFHPAADEPHWGITHKVLDRIRERGIASRASKVAVREGLDDPALVRAGAGNYAAMCASCHLAPGMAPGEIQHGMYPAPPNLAEAEGLEAAETFWVIKHGIKMSGMPAWGRSMDDEPIWGLTAFVLQLRGMPAEQYEAMVAQSGGHDHGGGATPETVAGDDHHAPMEGSDDAHGAAGSHEEGMESAAPGGAMDHSSMAGGGHEEGTKGMSGMDHGAPGGGMDHGDGSTPPKQKTGAMAGMDHSSMGGAMAAPTPEPRTMSGPAEATLQAFQDALQVGNVELALQRLASDVVVEEGGKVERTREEYAGGHLKADMALMKNAEVQLLNRSVEEGEQQTVIVSELRVTTTGAGEPVDVITEETATLRKTDDGWEIVRLELVSRPVVEERTL